MESGIILVDKDPGLSSAAVVGKIKRALKFEKVGHAGTLDPLATGLLVILTGSATRLVSHAQSGEKSYEGRFILGCSTTTDDISGEVISRSDNIPGWQEIEESVARYRGEISQMPPAVSALNVGGQRAYKLVREGITPELAPRTVTVHEFEVSQVSETVINYKVRCSKGTYIRSLARDIGKDLGCGGCVETIRRTASLPFRIEQAKPLAELLRQDLLDWRALFPGVPEVKTDLALALLSGDERALRRLEDTVERTIDDRLIFREMDGVRGGLLLWDASNRLNFAVNIHS